MGFIIGGFIWDIPILIFCLCAFFGPYATIATATATTTTNNTSYYSELLPPLFVQSLTVRDAGKGKDKGKGKGKEKGTQKGKDKGQEKGREKGKEKGQEKGKEKGKEKEISQLSKRPPGKGGAQPPWRAG